MTGFVYKWTNITNDKWYIGSHKGTIDDGYRHSSKIMKLAENKYGVDNFVRKILYVGHKYRKEEARYLNEYSAVNNTQSYNRSNMTGPDCFSKESIEKRAAQLRNRPKSKITRQRMSRSKLGNKNGTGNAGNILSAEHRRKISVANTGVRRGPQSKEHIKKRADKLRGVVPWNKNKTTGPLSSEHKEKIRRAKSNKPSPLNGRIIGPQEILTCPHCHKSGGRSNMKRWHYNNCKFRQ